ncbi:CLUMA_CG007443, isoform A [Clunio marinus]|uniref:CLUMA_CG007443, isoform A n=1 Tax=Clunio marinus TaxID=568069 RepID=A0A1J1I2U9_9DIPT|nr:CLUMA_CG007443, isoform A [Clunio marinus]
MKHSTSCVTIELLRLMIILTSLRTRRKKEKKKCFMRFIFSISCLNAEVLNLFQHFISMIILQRHSPFTSIKQKEKKNIGLKRNFSETSTLKTKNFHHFCSLKRISVNFPCESTQTLYEKKSFGKEEIYVETGKTLMENSPTN